MKIGLVFAGQGAQYTGMGHSLYENCEAAKKVMDEAGDQIKNWCFEGTKEMLRQTNITQPCIYTVTMAAYEALRQELQKLPAEKQGKIEVVGIAGFSLGEYSALTAASVIDDLRKGIDLVVRRGNLMNQAGTAENGEAKGGMAAAFGNRQDILQLIEETREDGILCGANYNSPVQTVVAGDKAALERFGVAGKAKKIKVMPLSVSTAFHSPMMEPAAEALKPLLQKAELKAPSMKIYSNITATDIMAGLEAESVSEYLAELMAKQTKSSVYWQEIVENMVADGAEVIIEIGPGKTLCGIVKKVNSEILTMNVEDLESLQKTMAVLEAE